MNFTEQNLRLYAVTDRAWTGKMTLPEQVEAALQGGATCVQLREKSLDPDAFLAEARAMAALCRRYGVPFLVNDNLDIALASGADGVHVGQDDLPVEEVRRRVGSRMIVGVSAHNVREALAAQAGGADYLGAGAVFGTATKKNVTPLARQTLCDICRAVQIPVVAIGGVGPDNLMQLAGTGVAGAAVVSAIFGAPDITAACRHLRALSDAMTAAPQD